MNISLKGQSQIELDHAFAVTATNFTMRRPDPTTAKAGSGGILGITNGFAPVTGSFKLAVSASGLEFDIDAMKAKEGGITISFTVGSLKYLITGCRLNEIDISVDQMAGNFDYSVSFIGTDIKRVN